MRSVSIVFLLFFSASVVAQEKAIRDAHAVKYPLSESFHSVQVSSAIECYLSQGEEESLAVSAYPEELGGHVLISVDKGVLKVRMDESKKWWSYRNSRVRVYVSCRRMDQITLTGASQLRVVDEVRGDRVSIECSGASDIKGRVEAADLSVQLTGASRASLKGTSGSLAIEASGSSDFSGFDMVSNECKVDASGASNIEVYAKDALDVLASGASNVDYKGQPRVKTLKTSGSSTLTKRE
jgi:hypothetical protein